MGRAVLEQQHARQRPPQALLAVRAAALRLRNQAGGLQRQPRHRVAQLVAVPAHKLLVEMLRREVAVALPVKLVHPQKLALRRTPRRHFADPLVPQPRDPVFLVANAQPAEVPA